MSKGIYSKKVNIFRIEGKIGGVVESYGVYHTTLSKKEFDSIIHEYEMDNKGMSLDAFFYEKGHFIWSVT